MRESDKNRTLVKVNVFVTAVRDEDIKQELQDKGIEVLSVDRIIFIRPSSSPDGED